MKKKVKLCLSTLKQTGIRVRPTVHLGHCHRSLASYGQQCIFFSGGYDWNIFILSQFHLKGKATEGFKEKNPLKGVYVLNLVGPDRASRK